MSVTYGPKLGKMINAATGDSFDADFRTLLRALDQLLEAVVLSRTLTAPPGSPANGAAYIVGPSAGGAWAGSDNKIAAWTTDDPANPSGAWEYFTPNPGWLVFSVADGGFFYWTGSAWAALSTGGGASAFTGLSDVPSSYSGAGGEAVEVNAGATALQFSTKPYDPMIFVPGVFTASQVIFAGTFLRACTFPAALTGAVAKLQVAATGSTVFSLQKNGTEFGTITFAGSGTVGTFASSAGTTFNGTTDAFSIVAPATPDGTAAGLSVSLKGTRT